MAIKIPARSYLTFSELKERWQCTENDLRYAVISGEIKPCVRLVGEHENIQWVKAYAGTCERKSTHDGSFILSHEPKGWVYLQEPCQTGPFDCRFDLASDERDQDKTDEWVLDSWYALQSPMTLDVVISTAVFLLTEVASYEERQSDEYPQRREQTPLGTRERDTLLTIIAVLAEKAGIDIHSPGKAALAIEHLTDMEEVHVSKRAIEEHLKKIPAALAVRKK